ncbi:MAG: hypothetical protein WCJ30_02530 [Deltaproteobacteria bacterium]
MLLATTPALAQGRPVRTPRPAGTAAGTPAPPATASSRAPGSAAAPAVSSASPAPQTPTWDELTRSSSSSGPPGAASTAPAPGSPAPSAAPASTAPAAVSTAPEPLVVHDPVAMGPVREAITLAVDVLHAERMASVECRYRTSAAGAWQTLAFERGAARGWTAQIPAQPLETRWLDYYLVVITTDGQRLPSFASEAAPHRTFLRPSESEATELRELADMRGNRSEVVLDGGYVDFGMARVTQTLGHVNCPSPQMVNGQPYCADWYYHVELSYRYRFLGVVRSVNFGAGHMRGATPAPVIGSWVGLDYGFGDLELRAASALTFSFRAILGATATTVQPGGGIGFDVIPSHAMRVSFRWQGVLGVGHLISGWMRWTTVRDWPMGAGIEVTNYPAANSDWAARMLVEVGHRFGRYLSISIHGGYQARNLAAGGAALGGRIGIEF